MLGRTPTERQIDVLRATLLHGRKAAAHRLGISEATVYAHIAEMRKRTGVHTTEQLVYLGGVEGWLVIPELKG